MSPHVPFGALALLAALGAGCTTEGPANEASPGGSRDTTALATELSGSRDTAAARAALDALWADYATAAVAGDVEGVAALYTATARLDVPGTPPVIGQEAIKAAWSEQLRSQTFTSLIVTPGTTLAPDSSTIHQIGVYAEGHQEKGKPVQVDYGRYLSAVVREADGRWRISYLMAFADSTRPAGER